MAGEIRSKMALDEAVAAWRERERREQPQLELFAEYADDRLIEHVAEQVVEGAAAADTSAALPMRRNRGGRPVGARNKRTDEAARHYMAVYGDPLKRGVEISALPILAPGVLEGLSERLQCSRLDAARWYASMYVPTLAYIHTKQAALTIKPEGAPDGDPVEWSFSDRGELVDMSGEPELAQEEAA